MNVSRCIAGSTLLALLLAAATPPLAAAQATAPAATQAATQPATRPNQFDLVLTVSPAKADGVAGSFAYGQLTLEPRNDNAATLYLQAFASQAQVLAKDIDQWYAVFDPPPEERDPAAVKAWLDKYQTTFDLCAPAAERAWADFGAPLRERGILTLLPYLNDSRGLANAMSYSIDYQRLRGERAEAEAMLRRLFLLGRHIGNSRRPVLVDYLVGAGIVALATDRAERLTEMPDAPNRYWALATMPRPLFDNPTWLANERAIFAETYPELREPAALDTGRAAAIYRELQGYAYPGSKPRDAATTRPAEATPERAVAYLRRRGYTDERLAGVTPVPEMLRQMVEEFHERFDAAARLVDLPFPQGWPLLRAWDEQRDKDADDGQLPTLAATFMPSLDRGYLTAARVQRQLDALRTVEAVRDYAADHGGLPPATLADCRLPVPQDAMTGRPFGYAAEGRVFTLTSPPIQEWETEAMVWTVTLRE